MATITLTDAGAAILVNIDGKIRYLYKQQLNVLNPENGDKSVQIVHGVDTKDITNIFQPDVTSPSSSDANDLAAQLNALL